MQWCKTLCYWTCGAVEVFSMGWRITLLHVLIRWTSLVLAVAVRTVLVWLKVSSLVCRLCFSFLFKHDCAPLHKTRSVTMLMTECRIGPDLNLIQHLWDELEWKLQTRPSSSALVSGPKFKNTLLKLVESLPRRVKAVIATMGEPTSL